MKQFSFRLNSILNYRSYLEKRAKIDLFNAHNEHLNIIKEIKRLEKKRKKIAKKCSGEGFAGITIPRYQMYRSVIQKLDHDLKTARINLIKSEEKAREKNAALKRESIKKKTLETLKNQLINKHVEELEKEEQRVIDELVIVRREEIV